MFTYSIFIFMAVSSIILQTLTYFVWMACVLTDMQHKLKVKLVLIQLNFNLIEVINSHDKNL